MRLPHLAGRIFDTPLLIAPKKLDAILAAIGPRIDVLPGNPQTVSAGDGFAGLEGSPLRVINSVAVIDVLGTLVHRSSYLDAASGLVSYATLSDVFESALADPSIRSILLNIDSPGGEVSGCFDFVDEIYAARGQKPIVAVANEMACSAAYAIASAADVVILPRTAEVGSIGVVCTHLDLSGAAAQAGVAVTYIYAGDRKVDGNPYEALPADVRDLWQAEIDKTYRIFVETVARNRGLATDAVVETQAGIFGGDDAVQAGLANGVMSFRETFDRMPGSAERRLSTEQRNQIATQRAADERRDRWAAQQRAVQQAEFEGRLQRNPALAHIMGRI